MPFAEIKLVPGVNVEPTAAGNPSGVQQSNFVRWRADLPEKRGGCTLYINQQVNGAPSSLKPWGDFQGENFLGIATPNAVYTYNATTQVLRDISPQSIVSASASPVFTASAGSQFVTIQDSTAPALTSFDAVQFNTPVAIAGLILNAIYPIQSVTGTNSYIIDVGYAASSSVTLVPGTLPVFGTTGGISRILANFPIQYQFDSLSAGNRIGFSVPTSVGGLTIFGAYVVLEILGSTSFSFQANYTAPSTSTAAMNNGFANLTYWKTTPPGIP
jgi:hypothetical protein